MIFLLSRLLSITDAADDDRTVGDDHTSTDIAAAYTAVANVHDHDDVSVTVDDHDAFLAAAFAASAAGADNNVVADVVNSSLARTTDAIRMRLIILQLLQLMILLITLSLVIMLMMILIL